MLDVRYSTKFKKDFKLCVKRGYKMLLLQQAIDTLRIPVPLPEQNKDHLMMRSNYIFQGLDFGFAVDPAAFVRVSYDSKREEILFLDEIYVRGWSNARSGTQ